MIGIYNEIRTPLTIGLKYIMKQVQYVPKNT